MDTHVAARTLGMTRLIPASPEAVFAAWTQPEQVQRWFGPRGMTCPACEIDLRAGGLHRTLMRDWDGKEFPNPMIIEAVEAPSRLVLRVPEGSACPLPGAAGTLLFLPDPAGTRFEVRWDHPTQEMRNQHEEMFFKGWGETIDKLTAHLLTPAAACPSGQPPTADHGWLHRMLGEWRYESECSMGPGQPTAKAKGTERVRSLGYWVVGESEGEMPGGGPARWIISMGWDPVSQRFRGTFIGSMMPHMFVYDGWLEADGRTLMLEAEGPSMTGEGTALYRDSVEMVGDDTRILRSAVKAPDGTWTTFMTGHFQRIG